MQKYSIGRIVKCKTVNALGESIQANYFFRWSMAISHNLTNSLNLNYNATNDNIINVNNLLGTDLSRSELNLFDNFLNIGEANYFNQSLSSLFSTGNIQLVDFINSRRGILNYLRDIKNKERES